MGNLLFGSVKKPPHLQGPTTEEKRAQADYHAKRRNDYFAQSQAAYSCGDGKLAKDLSNLGKKEAALMDKANKEAADLFFARNNAGRTDGMIDLHGLFVKEAIAVVERYINEKKNDKTKAGPDSDSPKTLTFIVGMGNHSVDHIPKLKPAIENLMRKHRLACTPDHPHKGCLFIEIEARKPGWFGVGGIEACIIS